MENDKLAKVMEKIRKLLRLAKSPNEHEASLAASRAHALLAEYNLDHADVINEKRDEVGYDSELVTTSYQWRYFIGAGVATLYYCKHMATTFKKGKTAYDRHSFVGRRHNVIVAKLVFEYLTKTVHRLAQQGARTLPAKRRSPYRTEFRKRCASQLYARLVDQRKVVESGGAKTDDGRNLPMLLDQYEQAQLEIDEYLKPMYESGAIKRVPVKTSDRIYDQQGLIDGYKAGREIGLDPQVAQQSAPLLK